MLNLPLLRKLAEYQQFPELHEGCELYYEESGDLRVLPLLALAQARLGELQQAEFTLNQALAREAKLDSDGWVDVAGACMLMQRYDEAQALLQQQLAHHPDHALAQARLGGCFAQTGELERAVEHLERALHLEPGRIVVYLHLIRLLLGDKQFNRAQQLLERAVTQLNVRHQELPEFVVASYIEQLRILQLEVWVKTGQYARAEEWLEGKRQELDEALYLPLLQGYATQLAEDDRHEQAEELLREGMKRFPDHIGLHLQLSELVQMVGRFLPATKLLHRAIQLAVEQGQESAGLWIKLSSASLFHFKEKARHAAEKALALTGGMVVDETHTAPMINQLRLQAKNAMAQVESNEQNYELAESLFRELLEESPHFIPALQGLGNQQMQRGQIDEAVALFERIKVLDPEQGYSALINARVFPEDEDTLHKMAAAAQRPTLEGSVRSGMLFQLAAAWEKRRDYERAFDFASQANAATRKLLHYDARKHRNHCARVRYRFSREFFGHRKGCGVDSTVPLYVVGMPRSGTTLVEQILSGHSEIFGAGELGLIPQVAQGLNRWERHVGSGRSYPDCIDDLTPYISAGIANNLLSELQEYSPESKHIVDKLPHNFENVGLIKFLFPNAKIISVRRDPRDIAISNYFTSYQARHGGMGFAYDLGWIGEQLADHNLLMHHWNQIFPGEILEVNYEDVVDDLEGSARRMLEYIGVAWEPQVLDFNKVERAVKTASVWQVRQPIYKTSKAKWERYRDHLEPLIRGTNARIEHDPFEMITLPHPGFLAEGVAHYNKGELDEAELSFKKMLHHNPDHAACNYMVGLVYLSKNYIAEGIEFLEKALEIAPWQREWRENLLRAYEMAGATERVAEQREMLDGDSGRSPASGLADDSDTYETMQGRGS